MVTCEHCHRREGTLTVVVYGGPEGEYEERWCQVCVSEDADPDDESYREGL